MVMLWVPGSVLVGRHPSSEAVEIGGKTEMPKVVIFGVKRPPRGNFGKTKSSSTLKNMGAGQVRTDIGDRLRRQSPSKAVEVAGKS